MAEDEDANIISKMEKKKADPEKENLTWLSLPANMQLVENPQKFQRQRLMIILLVD